MHASNHLGRGRSPPKCIRALWLVHGGRVCADILLRPWRLASTEYQSLNLSHARALPLFSKLALEDRDGGGLVVTVRLPLSHFVTN